MMSMLFPLKQLIDTNGGLENKAKMNGNFLMRPSESDASLETLGLCWHSLFIFTSVQVWKTDPENYLDH